MTCFVSELLVTGEYNLMCVSALNLAKHKSNIPHINVLLLKGPLGGEINRGK